MNDLREKTLARLSVAALAVDIMVITLIVIAVHRGLHSLLHSPSELVLYAIIPLVIAMHFIIVELIAGGNSIGRLSTGLIVRDEVTGQKPQASTALKRCGKVFLSGGIPSMNVQGVPRYNKNKERCLSSDWVGSVPEGNTTGRGQTGSTPRNPSVSSKPMEAQAAAIGLQVVSGPDKGKAQRLTNGKNFAKTGIFIVGRDPKHADLALVNDKSVSAIHCRVAVKNKVTLILDGKSSAQPSTMGTLVNKRKISNAKPTRLNPGDIVNIGNSSVRVL